MSVELSRAARSLARSLAPHLQQRHGFGGSGDRLVTRTRAPPCQIRRLPLDCHCVSGVSSQYRRGGILGCGAHAPPCETRRMFAVSFLQGAVPKTRHTVQYTHVKSMRTTFTTQAVGILQGEVATPHPSVQETPYKHAVQFTGAGARASIYITETPTPHVSWKYRGNIVEISWKYRGNVVEIPTLHVSWFAPLSPPGAWPPRPCESAPA
jgi:hypothetical protein